MYTREDVVVPAERRKEINEKIIYCIDNNMCEKYGISGQVIYNTYTGLGATHDYDFNDYDNYHQYSSAKKEYEMGQFFTPHEIFDYISKFIRIKDTDIVADLTAGIGSFANICPIKENVYLNEFEKNSFKVMKRLYPNANCNHGDIRTYNPDIKFNQIFGNPPYGLTWGSTLSQTYYIRKSHEMLLPGGILILVVPYNYLQDEFYNKNLISEINEKFNFIFQKELKSNAFKNVGVNNFKTKIMAFQKRNSCDTQIKDFTGEFIVETTGEKIFNKYMKEVYDELEINKGKLFLEEKRSNNNDEFEYKVNKYLYDIKRNPKISKDYAKALQYYVRFQTQTCPPDMDYKEWSRKKITKKKVLRYLKNIINKQNIKPKDEIRLVKTNYTLKYKAYSRKSKLKLNKDKLSNEQIRSINDLIRNFDHIEDPGLAKMIKNRRKKYLEETTKINSLEPDKEIQKFLEGLVYKDKEKEIRLTEIQKLDLNRHIQKNASLLQWDCGTGKSIGAISYLKFRLEKNKVHNGFIIGPAISIKNNFDIILRDYKIKYRKIETLKDIECIKKGEIVILTPHTLNKYKNQLKKFIKIRSKKVAVVFDESDLMKNINGMVYKCVMAVFKKVKYRLQTTGTASRNSILELFSQLEFTYNNSLGMNNECQYIYRIGKENDLKEVINPHYNEPFPAYKNGSSMFEKAFVPRKKTVFGLKKDTQDVYNLKALEKLRDQFITTRTFEEIAGRELATKHQILSKFSDEEKDLYKIIVQKFHELEHLYNSTGNSRKDSMLRIMHQLRLMIKACSIPHSFSECIQDEYSNKMYDVLEKISEIKETLVIGCRNIESVYEYQKMIAEKLPERKIYVITGEKTTLKKRLSIIAELRNEPESILICTQQSLSVSMNIEFIDHILIPELAWNEPTMRQFYMRFIRLNSKNAKNIYYFTYAGSIETNMLQLLINKEKINRIIKNTSISEDDLYESFGIDFDLSEMLMSREEDSEGNSYIACNIWEDQKIS